MKSFTLSGSEVDEKSPASGCSSSQREHIRSPLGPRPRPCERSCMPLQGAGEPPHGAAPSGEEWMGLQEHGHTSRAAQTRSPALSPTHCSVSVAVCERRTHGELTLKSAWRPFSAACSSSFLFSSGVRFPAFSAAWICSKTCFKSIAARRVETLAQQLEQREARIIQHHSRLAEHVVFALHVVIPPTHAKERLVRREILLRFLRIHEPNSVQ